MAREDHEGSTESGQPVSLYKFQYGPNPGDYYAYTNAENPVTHDGVVYSPDKTLDQLSDIESKQKQNKAEMKLRFALESEIVSLFKFYPPNQVVRLTIREGHLPNPDDPTSWALGENFPVAWIGKVLEVEREQEHADLVCDNSAASMLRPGLRGHYQYPCRHTVYEGRCGADKARYHTPSTVVSATGNRVVLINGWQGLALPVNNRPIIDYHKGRAEWDGPVGRNVRTILRVENETDLILSGPTTDLGATIDLYIGCTKFLDFCRDVHLTPLTYGGWIGVPTSNPIGKNNHT